MKKNDLFNKVLINYDLTVKDLQNTFDSTMEKIETHGNEKEKLFLKESMRLAQSGKLDINGFLAKVKEL